MKGSANFNESSARPYTAEDIRFTTKGDTLYAFALAWPADGRLRIKTLRDGPVYPRDIARIELLGAGNEALPFTRGMDDLVVSLPASKPGPFVATLKIVPA